MRRTATVVVGSVLLLVATLPLRSLGAHCAWRGPRPGREDRSVPVAWDALDLTRKAPDGTVTVRPVVDRLRELFPVRYVAARPFVVWILGPDADRQEMSAWNHTFRKRDLTLALERFRCLRIHVRDLPEGESRKRLARGAGFHFFDPAGDPVGRPLVGRRARSAAAFKARQSAAWRAGYALPLREYLDARYGIQDRHDRIRTRQWIIRWELGRLRFRPSPKRRAGYEADLERLREESKVVAADLAALVARCRPGEKFLAVPVREPARPRLR